MTFKLEDGQIDYAALAVMRRMVFTFRDLNTETGDEQDIYLDLSKVTEGRECVVNSLVRHHLQPAGVRGDLHDDYTAKDAAQLERIYLSPEQLNFIQNHVFDEFGKILHVVKVTPKGEIPKRQVYEVDVESYGYGFQIDDVDYVATFQVGVTYSTGDRLIIDELDKPLDERGNPHIVNLKGNTQLEMQQWAMPFLCDELGVSPESFIANPLQKLDGARISTWFFTGSRQEFADIIEACGANKLHSAHAGARETWASRQELRATAENSFAVSAERISKSFAEVAINAEFASMTGIGNSVQLQLMVEQIVQRSRSKKSEVPEKAGVEWER